MKIYVITKGSYSDYHVCAVATDKEKAEKLAKLLTDRYDTAEVEEYDTEAPAAMLEGRLPYEVCFDQRGNVVNTILRAEELAADDFQPAVEEHDCTFFGQGVQVWVSLYAPDEATAVKVAAEKRAEFLARKEGLT